MRSRLFTRIIAVVAGSAMVASPALLTAAEAAKPGKPLTVMTRNIYLGADINRPVRAAAIAQAQPGATPQSVLVALGNATHETRTIVDTTNFPARSELLADEVAETLPDLIGLQEVALWRSGPLQLTQVGVPNATTVDYDYLQILLDELAERGLSYQAVEIGNRADVEAPSFTGSPFNGTMGQPRDVRMTMRDVILMRTDNALRATATGDEIFEHSLQVSVAGVAMNFDRGYNWVDVKVGAGSARFVNSHFEAFGSDIALAQATELLADAPASDRTTIFACDCNSDPLDSSVKPADTVPHKAPYDLIVSEGFTDQWLEWAPAEEGWTSGLSELVDDETTEGFDHRIDMVFARTPAGDGLQVDRGELVGDELGDRDPVTGLWPSDHAGVVLRLRGF